MTGGLISFRYFKAETTCVMIDLRKCVVGEKSKNLVKKGFQQTIRIQSYIPGFPFADNLVLFQVEIQIVTVTVFEDGTKRVGVDLEHVKQPDDSRMVQLFVNIVLPQGVLDIIGFLVVLPVLVQLMDLTRHVPLLLQVPHHP